MSESGEAILEPVGWSARVKFAPGPEGFAYVPGEVLTTGGAAARALAERLFPDDSRLGFDEIDVAGLLTPFQRFTGVPDPLLLVQELRLAGFIAQPNHVFFAHCCEECCGPHPSQLVGSPVYATPVYATPVYATPVYATPVYATSVTASPVYATPVYATDLQATGKRPSSVRPLSAADAEPALTRLGAAKNAAAGTQVFVLDTGVSEGTFMPTALEGLATPFGTGTMDVDLPDSDGDLDIDPVAGHGTFIAGLIEQVAPGSRITVIRVMHPEGDANEVVIAQAIGALPNPDVRGAVLSLSFGGYALDQPALFGAAIRGAQAKGYVVVASAGNDARCRPTYPAAFPDVIGVGAVGPQGPAQFTNYGSWVRACAPGVDVVSTHFSNFEDEDLGAPFVGWARWSGTSFSAPVVAAAIAWEMETNTLNGAEAVARVIDHPSLLRLPGLGTVVNRL